MKIKIANKSIGEGEKPFIIAEAGVNHNGRLDLALKMVDAAAVAGADAIKTQTFKAGQVTIGKNPMADYQKKNIGKSESQLEMIKKLELKDEFYGPIVERCKKRGIIFLSAPHGGFGSVDFLKKLNVPAFKFGSGDLTNLPVLEYAAKLKKPIILSTGMANLKETKEAVACIKKIGNHKIIVLHCTTNYPCAVDEVNLRAMQTMMKKLDVLIGYSDHTLSLDVPMLAVALGASVIEKHFTLDRTLKGPDHMSSLESDELKQMVDKIRQVSTILGNETKKPTKNEIKLIPIARKSVVSLKDIRTGKIFTKKNIGIKRPGNGLAPKNYNIILGKKAKLNIKTDSLIQKKHYE